jgi:hypothetical protein
MTALFFRTAQDRFKCVAVGSPGMCREGNAPTVEATTGHAADLTASVGTCGLDGEVTPDVCSAFDPRSLLGLYSVQELY